MPRVIRSLWRTAGRIAMRLAATAAFIAALTALATPAAGQGAEVAGPDSTLTVEVRKGQVVRLPGQATTVFVADPEVADVQAQSPTLVYVFGKRAGTTSLYAVDGNDRLLLRAEVRVQHNLSALRDAARQLLPGRVIRVESIDGSIILQGAVETPREMADLRDLAGRYLGDEETLLNRVRVTSPTQVHLRVQVAEVSREVFKTFGISLESFFRDGEFAFGFATGRDLMSGPPFFRGPAQSGASTPGGVFGDFTAFGGNGGVASALDILAEEGLVNLLAEPNLTALSGETASFLAGGEFPIPVAADEDEIKIEFKEFGISLAFTPTVLAGERISLRVRPEVSELTSEGAITLNSLTIPALATRRAETTVELGSGQSFMIGGLLSTDMENALSKFPGLGDLPVLGVLFRSQRFQRNETELVITVTPYLVRPVNEPVLATPNDGYVAPSDLERILEGRLHSARIQTGSAGPLGPEGQRLAGPIGFILD